MRVDFNLNEIDHHVLKFIVGITAIVLANLTVFLSGEALASISEAYHTGGWARDFFVGLLFAISAFLSAYNGSSVLEMLLSKVAAAAALLVALFPCECGTGTELVPYLHYIAAAIMFVILACFCVIFYRRARAKGHREAVWRSYLYALCGVIIIIAMAVLAFDHIAGRPIGSKLTRLIFYGERAGLVAFGVSWLVASRALPLITAPSERISIVPISSDKTAR